MEEIRHFRIKLIFVIGTVLLLSLSVFSYLRINNLMKTSALVNHTNVVKLELESLFSELKDAESSHRGYILTHNKLFLNQFNSNIINVYKRMERLNRVTKDNYSQQRNIEVLKVFVDKRTKYMHEILREADNKEITTERWLAGRVLMDSLRKQVDKMMDEEDFLLRIRTKSLTKESSLTPLFTIFLIICSILVLIASYYGINRELKISNALQSDLTESQKGLLNANEFLAEKNKSLAKMNKELESFTYISSHDLQEPLRKIQTFVTRINDTERDKLSENGKNYLNRTQDAANRMQNLIRDLLAYSRLNAEIFPTENTNLEKIVNQVKRDLDEEIKEKNATIEVKGDAEIRIIPSQFRQLLINLISNSMKFCKDGNPPHITIENTLMKGSEVPFDNILPDSNYSRLKISDNGIGFEAQYKSRIFEVFQRLHVEKDYPGTGIGLAIVKKIVENHDGFITADSEMDCGAVFTIYLPFDNSLIL
jgi:signal transduction histidine kinase